MVGEPTVDPPLKILSDETPFLDGTSLAPSVMAAVGGDLVARRVGPVLEQPGDRAAGAKASKAGGGDARDLQGTVRREAAGPPE